MPFLIEKIIFPFGDFLLGTEFVKQLKIHRRYANYNKIELKKLQTEKLIKLLDHSTTTCQAYKNYRFDKNYPKMWLKKFPIISKREIVKNTDEYISSKYKKTNLIKEQTSGSSGIRTVVYIDKKELSTSRAILINWWEWNGYILGKPLVQTGITPDRGIIKTLKDKILNIIYIDAFGLNDEQILKKLQLMKRGKKYTLFGFASSLYEIAVVAEKYGLEIQFDLAMSQGDKLFDHYKKKIEKVFKCRVVEDYGLGEGIQIGQKKDLPYFYIYTPSVYIEILDENNQSVPDGQMGRIIATNLDGYAMPLIRYDTGDLGVMLPYKEYPKERDLAFPLLKTVVGRNTDIIKTPDGKTLIVHTFTGIFEFFPEIKQFQVLQDQVDSITIRYIPSEKFTNGVLKEIEQKIRERIKSSITIHWMYVDNIAPSKSGKPQIIINNLLKNSLSNTI